MVSTMLVPARGCVRHLRESGDCGVFRDVEKDLALEKTEERGTLTHVKTEEPATGQGAHTKKREEEIREEVDDDDAQACVRARGLIQV